MNPPLTKEPFPTWRIVVYSLGGIGSSLIGSLAGLLTYFYVPPETTQAAFPVFISTQTILGLTLVGVIGYLGNLLSVLLGPVVASWSDRSRSRIGRRKIFMLVSFVPVSVFSYLLFQPPVPGISPLNAGWLLAVVLLLNLFRSAYNVNGALVPELGTSSKIIMRFSTYSAIGWLAGYVVGSQGIFVIKDALMDSGLSAVDAFRLTVGGAHCGLHPAPQRPGSGGR
jgi:Na+/melibiose symporter-like transporter